MRRLAVVAAVLAAATAAHADDAVVGLAPDGRAVTSAGTVLAPVADGTWTRVSTGGVGVPLVDAHAYAGDLWATGAEAPAFRFAGGVWSALPVRRSGTARLSTCAAPGFASGKRVFVPAGPAAGKWKELRRLPGRAPLVTLCFADATHAAVLHEDGALFRLDGAAWRPVTLPAAARATWLGGGTTPLVATDRGELYRLDAATPTRIRLDPSLPAFVPRAAAATVAAPKRTILLGSDATGAAVLARLDAGKPLARLDAPPAGDWIALTASADGAIRLIARDGTSARRDPAGTWSASVPLKVIVEEAKRGAENPPARVGP